MVDLLTQFYLKVVSRCGRFGETVLKWIGAKCQTSTDEQGLFKLTDEVMQKLYYIFAAQLGFLQGEYANLVVQSTFDTDTAKYFHQFESNQSTFYPLSLKNVRVMLNSPPCLTGEDLHVEEATTSAAAGGMVPASVGSSWRMCLVLFCIGIFLIGGHHLPIRHRMCN